MYILALLVSETDLKTKEQKTKRNPPKDWSVLTAKSRIYDEAKGCGVNDCISPL